MDTDLTGSTEQVESKWVLVRDALSTHCQWGICLSWTEQIFRENCLKNIQSYYSFFFFFFWRGSLLWSPSTLSPFKKNNYFWQRRVFIVVRRLFSSAGKRGLLFIAVLRLLIAVASRWSSRAPECRLSSRHAQAYLLLGTWNLLTRDRTCVPCIDRWILYHWTTSEVPNDYYREIHIEHRKRRESWEPVWIISSPPNNCLCWFSLSPGWWLM